MKLTPFLLACGILLNPVVVAADPANDHEEFCPKESELNVEVDEDDDCVAAILPGEQLGLPNDVEVTNFAPFLLPALAVAGAAAAAAVAGAGGNDGGGTNGTN